VSSVSAFVWAVGAVSIAGGFIGSVSGFGIGSLVTPVLATELGTRTAVAAVSLPHAIGTAVRFWTLRHNVNRRLLWSFGLTSAIGGLVGALLQARANSRILTAVFASLLVFAGVAGVTGWARRMRFGRRGSWVAGALSGMFGGLVGNQGGIRSAAMLGIELDLPPHEFVATATAVALFVDSARVPVYLITEWPELRQSSNWIAVSTLGVVIGTVLGLATLRSIPEARFRRLVSLLILALGVYMFTRV
jgi:uncharacterized membrane protein YfcA